METSEGEDLDIREVISYEGLYTDILQEGEQAMFRGLLERVERECEEPYHRVLIGSMRLKGRGYIKPLIPRCGKGKS